MKKLYIGFFALILLIGTAIIISFAWFTNSEFVEPDLSGYSISAYFGGGDGSEDDPYQIKNQRHLYNLAWLQYLGYFNKPGSGNTPDPSKSTLTQYQFVITQDINMDNWTLPPIGTSLRPFIGLLNGNGHKIYNLKTSNEFIDFGNRHPNNVNSTNFANAEIIGFIGAIGATEQMENSSYTFSSEQNAVANIKLSDNTVKTITPSTLVGIAVGYINGTVEDLGIVNSKVDVGSTCSTRIKDDLSSYTVAGYAEDDFVTKTNRTNAIVINPTNTIKTTYVFESNGDVTGWGGSIDMYTMYNNVLLPKWNSSYTNKNFYYYYTKKTITVDSDGYETVVYSPEPPTKYERFSISGLGNHEYTYDSSYVGDKKIASYSFLYRENENSYMYVAGNETRTITNATSITYVYDDAYYITDNNGNYLVRNNNTVSNVTTQSSASKWYFIDDSIYTLVGTTKYYLNDDEGNIAVGQVNYTSWSKTNNSIESSEGRYLIYDNGWKLNNTNTKQEEIYKISYTYNNTRYYLNADFENEETTYTTNVNNATLWYVNSQNYLYAKNNNQNYYLTSPQREGRNPIELTTQIKDYSFIKSGNTAYFIGRYSRMYYLYYGYDYNYNINWNAYTTSPVTLTWTQSQGTSVIDIVTQSVPNGTGTENFEYTTIPMYIPLQFGTDVNGNYGVDVKNTGYLIGGSYRGSGQAADIRVSKYPMSSVSASYTPSNGFSKIYTINTSGVNVEITNSVITNSKWTKYQDSLTSLGTILANDSSNVYGLHFMESTISKNHIITADWVSINGSDYIPNYQLPEDSIDFNLKEKGKVNFFAGTYFNGNNSFFSYNEIQRNANNEITDIKQISEIYSDGIDSHSYVYKYSDGKYSVPYIITNNNGVITKTTLSGGTYTEYSTQSNLPSGYSSIFKTSWIGKQSSTYTSNRIYYFEVPTNDGEYALGSVKSGKGAYLLYLDIGANAQQINRTEIRQKTSVIENFYVFPNGIAIILANTNIDATIGTDSIDASLSAVTRTNVTGAILVNRTGENEITATTNSNIDSTYVPRTVTLKKNSSEMAAAAVKTTTSIYSQIQYIDYNLTTNAVFETTIQGVTKDNSTTYSFKVYNYTTRELIDTTVERPAWNLYAVVNNKNVIVDLNSASDTNATAIKNTLATIKDSTGTTLLDYNYDTLADSTNTFDIMIKMILDTNDSTGKYYKFSGNDVTITTDDENPSLIYVTIADTTKALKINETTITSVPSQINW